MRRRRMLTPLSWAKSSKLVPLDQYVPPLADGSGPSIKLRRLEVEMYGCKKYFGCESITCLIILMWQTAAAEFMFTQRKVIMRPKITTLSTAVSEVSECDGCSECLTIKGKQSNCTVGVT
eukprot:Em0014g497a